MAISAETFQAIVKSVRSGQARSARPGFVGTAVIVPRTDNTAARPVNVLVRDLSPTELSFVHDKPQKTGESFLLCIKDGGETRAIVCTVSRWHPLNDGLVSVTAALTREAVSMTRPTECADVDVEHVKSIDAKLRAAMDA